MAVRPWIGQIAEPDNHNPVNNDKPDTRYALDYVYGYRCADTRQNVFINGQGNVCYMTAALGVVLDHNANTQLFFGGGEVENQSKQKRNDDDAHTNDIMAMDLCSHRKMCLTGQVGSSPTLFLWNAMTGEKIKKFQVSKGARAINACAISVDNKLIACVDLHNEHQVHVFDVSTGASCLKAKGDTNKIYDIKFSQQPGSTSFCTVGNKHCYFWDAAESGGNKKKGLFKNHDMTSFACVAYDNEGKAYTGGSNSLIYKWEGRDCVQTIAAHDKGFICTMRWNNGTLYSGGKDGNIVLLRTSDCSVQQRINFGNPIRAVDFDGTNMVVGLRNGTIVHTQPDASAAKKEIMHSHNEGEVWGLDFDNEGCVYTSADDNQVLVWDPSKRCKKSCFKVTDRKAKSKRGGASSLSHLPDSQCSRAVAVCGNDLAVAGNDGAVMIKDRVSGAEKCLI